MGVKKNKPVETEKRNEKIFYKQEEYNYEKGFKN